MQAQVQQQRYCLDSGIFFKHSICEGELVAPNQYGTIAPVRSFFHNSLIDTLKSFFLRDGFAESLNKWKQRQTLPETLSDIFDGRVWKNFKLRETDDKPFFQAYKDGYSVGAIYLTIQNLPRKVRNLRSDSIRVCLINGPKEPKTYEMNNYLRPLVKELLVLMNGVEIRTKSKDKQVVKAALSLCMMDLPAQRKVVGFASCNSINACYKCKKQFDAIIAGDKARDFSNFDVDKWIRRTCE
ncbi:hypothetical protein A0J61_11941, partial [Choanephora cucurbitarum]